VGKAGQGRPAKPTSLKVLHGDRKDRINTSEPQPTESTVTPPAWLALADAETEQAHESALDVWRRMAPDLIKRGVLTAWDVEAFAVYCDAVVKFRQASLEVTRGGMTIEGARGSVKNPAVTAAKDYADLMQRYGARFGLTPSDRASLSVKGDEDAGKGAERLLG
jgi:P27 family predicted phage terminase small subunit